MSGIVSCVVWVAWEAFCFLVPSRLTVISSKTSAISLSDIMLFLKDMIRLQMTDIPKVGGEVV